MHTQTLYKRSELSVKQEQTLKTPKVITHCIGFTSVFSLIGLENSHLSFDQSDAKTKINHDLFSHIFPRFGLGAPHLSVVNTVTLWSQLQKE